MSPRLVYCVCPSAASDSTERWCVKEGVGEQGHYIAAVSLDGASVVTYDCDSVLTEGVVLRGRDTSTETGLTNAAASTATKVLRGVRGTVDHSGAILVGSRRCSHYPVGGSSPLSGVFSRQVETVLRVASISEQSRSWKVCVSVVLRRGSGEMVDLVSLTSSSITAQHSVILDVKSPSRLFSDSASIVLPRVASLEEANDTVWIACASLYDPLQHIVMDQELVMLIFSVWLVSFGGKNGSSPPVCVSSTVDLLSVPRNSDPTDIVALIPSVFIPAPQSCAIVAYVSPYLSDRDSTQTSLALAQALRRSVYSLHLQKQVAYDNSIPADTVSEGLRGQDSDNSSRQRMNARADLPPVPPRHKHAERIGNGDDLKQRWHGSHQGSDGTNPSPPFADSLDDHDSAVEERESNERLQRIMDEMQIISEELRKNSEEERKRGTPSVATVPLSDYQLLLREFNEMKQIYLENSTNDSLKPNSSLSDQHALERSRAEIDSYRDAKMRDEEEIARLLQAIASQKSSYDLLLADANSLNIALNQAKSSLNDSEEHRRSLADEMKGLSDERLALLNTINNMAESINRRELDLVEAQRGALERDRAAEVHAHGLAEESARHQSRADTLASENETLRHQVTELVGKAAEWAVEQDQMDADLKSILRLSDELSSGDAHDCEADSDSRPNLIEHVTNSVRSEINYLRNRVHELETLLLSKNEEVSRIETASEVGMLRGSLSDANQTIDAMRREVRLVRQEHAALKLDVANARQESLELRFKCSSLEISNNELSERMSDSSRRLDAKVRDVLALSAALSAAETEVSNMKGASVDLQMARQASESLGLLVAHLLRLRDRAIKDNVVDLTRFSSPDITSEAALSTEQRALVTFFSASISELTSVKSRLRESLDAQDSLELQLRDLLSEASSQALLTATWQKHVTSLEARLSEAHQRILERSDLVAALESELTETGRALAELQKSENENRRIGQGSLDRSAANALRNEVAELKSEARTLRSLLSVTKQSLEREEHAKIAAESDLQTLGLERDSLARQLVTVEAILLNERGRGYALEREVDEKTLLAQEAAAQSRLAASRSRVSGSTDGGWRPSLADPPADTMTGSRVSGPSYPPRPLSVLKSDASRLSDFSSGASRPALAAAELTGDASRRKRDLT